MLEKERIRLLYQGGVFSFLLLVETAIFCYLGDAIIVAFIAFCLGTVIATMIFVYHAPVIFTSVISEKPK